MTEEMRGLLSKADESIDVARELFEGGHFGFSASRAYYAMFYLAEALLLTQGLSFSKHSGVISAFAQHFVKTGLFDSRFHDYLIKAFDLRHVGDYEATEHVSQASARLTLKRAEEFRAAVRDYLGNDGEG